MVCGGFGCSKVALVILNLLYIIVSIILIAVGAYSKAAAVIGSLNIVGGVIACGVFLFFIALIGLIGAFKHEQVLLFFYMIILFIIFLIQFSVGIACLAVTTDQEEQLLAKTWHTSSNSTQADFQKQLQCCGFNSNGPNDTHPSCAKLLCCKDSKAPCCTDKVTPDTKDILCPCKTCFESVRANINNAFAVSGGVGLFFSFTEILGVWLAFRYRHMRDPKADPSSFL